MDSRIHDVAEYIHQNVPHPPFFLQYILPRGGVLLLYGEAGMMKSWMALYMAHCIATGSDWLDLHTVQARVLIVNFEISPAGYHDRLVLISNTFTVETAMLYEATFPSKFLDEQGTFDWFMEEVVLPVDPGVVILDCFAKCYGGDENSNQELGRFFSKIDVLREQGRGIVLIHHSNKNLLVSSPMGKARGGTRLVGDPDSVIYMVNQPTGKQLQFGKVRLSPFVMHSKNIIFQDYIWRLR